MNNSERKKERFTFLDEWSENETLELQENQAAYEHTKDIDSWLDESVDEKIQHISKEDDEYIFFGNSKTRLIKREEYIEKYGGCPPEEDSYIVQVYNP